MESSINQFLREFYLGDNSAWEKICDALSEKLKNRLHRKYKFDIPEHQLGECVPQWEANFFAKVLSARREAEEQIENAVRKLSKAEIEKIKIDCCAKKTTFDLSKKVPFEAWMWNSLKHRIIDLQRKNKFRAETEDDTDIESLTSEVPANPVNTPFSGGENEEAKNKLKELLKPALKDDELVCLDLWFKKNGEPSAQDAKDLIQKVTGKSVSGAYITNLKQSFLMKCYLYAFQLEIMQ